MEEYTQCVKPIDHPHSNILPQTMEINDNSVVVVIDTQNYIYNQYIFLKNGIAYIFDFSNNAQPPGEEGQVQQILDSVKFSQPTIILPK